MSSQPPLPEELMNLLRLYAYGDRFHGGVLTPFTSREHEIWQDMTLAIRAYGEACAAVEREACAMLVQTQRIAMLRNEREGLAQLIRARGGI